MARQIYAVRGDLRHLLLVERITEGTRRSGSASHFVVNGEYEMVEVSPGRLRTLWAGVLTELVMDVPRSSVLIDALVSDKHCTFAEAAEAVKDYNGIIEACSILIRQSQTQFSAESSSGRAPV